MRSLLACLCLLFVTAAAAAGHDFDGDSRSDVLWRHTDGTNYVWHVDGAVINGGVLSIPSQGGAMQLTRRIQRVIEFFASAMLAVSFPVMLSAEPLTTEQGDAILNELRAIRGLLERQQQRPPAPAAMPENNEPVKANVKGAQALGRADAPVTIVAFIDYQCPFCKRFDTDTLPELKKRYIDSGKVRYVIRDLPLERIHPRAHKAAEATYCAADQGKFWQMRDKLSANVEKLEPEALAGYAREIGVRADQFNDCLERGKHVETVKHGLAQARELGITGTPTFVIGKTNGEFVTGVKRVGALPFPVFEQKIKELLGGS